MGFTGDTIASPPLRCLGDEEDELLDDEDEDELQLTLRKASSKKILRKYVEDCGLAILNITFRSLSMIDLATDCRYYIYQVKQNFYH